MSYIGRLPVKYPANVSIKVLNNNKSVYIEGPQVLKLALLFEVFLIIMSDESKQKSLLFENKKFKKFWGLARTQLADLFKEFLEDFV